MLGAVAMRKTWRDPAARFMGVAWLLVAAYALGRYTPLFGAAFALLPGVDLFRRPADATFMMGALSAYLAGFGLCAMLRAEVPPWRSLAGVVVGGAACAFALALFVGALAEATSAVTLAAGFIGLGAGLILGLRRSRLMTSPRLAAALVAALVAFDFAINLRPNESTGVSPQRFAFLDSRNPPALIVALRALIVQEGARRDRVDLCSSDFDSPNFGLVHGFEAIGGYNPLRLDTVERAMLSGGPPRDPDLRPFGRLLTGYSSPFAAMLGLRFVLVPNADLARCLPDLGPPLHEVARTPDGVIYEHPNAFPRVRIVPRAIALDQDRLIEEGWPADPSGAPPDLVTTAFVEPTNAALPEAALPGEARILAYAPTRVEIAVDAEGGGLLVLHDIWHPDWRAEIDGRAAPILRTNGAFRGVILPKDARIVTFIFAPLSGLGALVVRE
jgi:hypothetical protein